MSVYSIKVSETPDEVLHDLMEKINYKVVHKRVYKLDGDMSYILIVYEKYFYRNNSTAAVTVTVNNFNGVTEVEIISARSSSGLFGMDLGAGDELSQSIQAIFEDCVID